MVRKKKNIMALFGAAKEDEAFIRGLKKAYKEREKNELRVY